MTPDGSPDGPPGTDLLPCFSIPYFIALQSTVILMNVIYILAFAIMEFYTTFHIILLSISSFAVLRSSFSMAAILTSNLGLPHALLTISLFLDFACYNFAMGGLFQLALHRYLQLRNSKWNKFFFEDYLFHTWLSFFVFTALLAIAQVGLSTMKRQFVSTSGFVETNFSRFWLQCVFMKVTYIFPLLVLVLYVLFLIRLKKLTRDQKKYKDIPGERNRAILIIFVSLLQVSISAFYEYNQWTRSPDHAQQASIDQMLTFFTPIPDLFTPLFLVCSMKKFHVRWADFRTPVVGPSAFFTQG